MPNSNFMLTDLAAISAGFCVAFLFAFVPGYVLGWIGNVLEFRRRRPITRTLLSIVLSLSLCPILTYLAGRFLTSRGVWALHGLFWLSFAGLMARQFTKRRSLRTMVSIPAELRLPAVLVAVWVVVGICSLADLQVGRRLYFPVSGYDYSIRTAFTSAISRTGLPPDNPLFYPGHSVPLRYHYFWLIPASLTDQVGGDFISARQAMIASALWCGIALIALIPLYLRFFVPNGAADIRRRSLIGAGLLGVTGLDLLPTALFARSGVVHPSMEWWNQPVMGWIHEILWVPHHVAGLIACLTGLLIVWRAKDIQRRRAFVAAGMTAGLAFGTAVGSSIYVTFVFAVVVVLWTLVTAARRVHRETIALVMAGGTAFLVTLPYVLELRGPAAGGAFVQWEIRYFVLADIAAAVFHLPAGWQTKFLHLALVPLNYFLEFGLFFMIGVMRWKAYRQAGRLPRREDAAAVLMVAASVLIATFLRSGVIQNNDLGWRSTLVAQFVLLLWAADFLSAHPGPDGRQAAGGRPFRACSGGLRAFLIVLIALGVAGTAYELMIGRFYPLLADAGKVPPIIWLAPDRRLGERTYAVREAYEWIRNTLPERAIVQHNPDTVLNDLFFGLYAERQAVADTRGCGAGFGGDPRACPDVFAALSRVFGAPGSAAANDVDVTCRDLRVDALLVKDTDPVWSDRTSWVWVKRPVLASPHTRVILCGMSQGYGMSSSLPTGKQTRR